MSEKGKPLRSDSWFKPIDNAGFEHGTHLKARGHLPEMFEGRPVIGILILPPCLRAHASIFRSSRCSTIVTARVSGKAMAK